MQLLRYLLVHRHFRNLLLLVVYVLSVFGSSAPINADSGRTHPSHSLAQVRVDSGQLRVDEQPFVVRGINYIHVSGSAERCRDLHFGADGNCPWEPAAIEADMARLQQLGVNSIRIFLNYYVFGGARSTNPRYDLDPALAHLDALIDAANRHDIYVLPVLLAKYPQDRMNAAGIAEAVALHVEPVVRHLAGRPGLLGWDLFNEPDIGSPIDERCWDWDNGDFPLCRQLAAERTDFLTGIQAAVRRHDPEQLITIGMGFAKSYFRPGDSGPRMAALVDFYSFHYYDNDPFDSGRYRQHWYYGAGFPGDLRRAIDELAQFAPPKPVLISELGFPSDSDSQRTAEETARDLQRSIAVIHDTDAAGVLFWPFQPTHRAVIGDRFVDATADGGASSVLQVFLVEGIQGMQ